ncbi:MAG: hypothetical protein ACRYG8_05630, partial [Janthinobacterium lividum]
VGRYEPGPTSPRASAPILIALIALVRLTVIRIVPTVIALSITLPRPVLVRALLILPTLAIAALIRLAHGLFGALLARLLPRLTPWQQLLQQPLWDLRLRDEGRHGEEASQKNQCIAHDQLRVSHG